MDIGEIREKIVPVLEQYNIRKASLFGSMARGEARPDSDIDLLVELGQPNMGLIGYIKLKNELESVLEKNVDLVTEGAIHRHMEPYIREELKTIYENR